jgi:hypothetical protein
MRLNELFDQPAPKPNTVSDRLRQMAIDFLTPLVAHKVPFITVQQMVDELRRRRPGILVDRALVMSLLDPEQVKSVKEIEGDRINLQQPDSIEHAVDDDGAEAEVNKIKDMAKQKAQKDVTAPAATPAPAAA